MKNTDKNGLPAELQEIPGVGPKIAVKLTELGINSLEDISKSDPMDLYTRCCLQTGHTVDRCVLYVFRCAVYFTSNTEHDPELLKWWNWKD